MNNNYELQHYGVLGMKWGKRKRVPDSPAVTRSKQRVAETKAKAIDLMEKSIAAKKRGDYAKADDLYGQSKFLIRLLKDAGEDVEAIR